ncbi:endonuclease domain-containing protein [Sphingomonas gilva]|uniref:Endonuclease domain-containing protein n=1 Tax=Sphingomonas gilva TaxID=2305907 RepID=A0A396RTK6_9SPHN|nr:endonuclease domain-containing protein [Sphingomonas gilva]RHW17723.1 endonuclease domain-containing protein [Sphingomonas gilva]
MQRPVVYAARRLRKTMSLPEVLLWQRLRSRPHGLKFRKQHPIEPYIVDFFCSEAALVIEVDGIAHDMGGRPDYDERREALIRTRGFDVLHIAAKDILRDVDAAAASIVARAANPLHRPAAGPPPRSGED